MASQEMEHIAGPQKPVLILPAMLRVHAERRMASQYVFATKAIIWKEMQHAKPPKFCPFLSRSIRCLFLPTTMRHHQNISLSRIVLKMA
jgi:hypothetical protein